MRKRLLAAVAAAAAMAMAGCDTGPGGSPASGTYSGGSYGSASSGAYALSQLRGATIVAQDGQFLGVISNNKFDSKSIINTYGEYGSKYSSTSIMNKYGTYGSEYSNLSPFNAYSNKPPIITLDGRDVAYLTVNTSITPRIDPYRLIGYLESESS